MGDLLEQFGFDRVKRHGHSAESGFEEGVFLLSQQDTVGGQSDVIQRK